MFRTKAVDKTKTDILRSITFFRKLCRLLDNVKYTVMRGRSQKAIWRMRVTYWIPRTTHTHTHTHSEMLLLFQSNNGVRMPLDVSVIRALLS